MKIEFPELESKSESSLFFAFSKRAMDVLGSIVFMIIFSPFYIIFGILIWFQDFHSPIYVQKRVGQFNKIFTIHKFRSMVINADLVMMQDANLYNQLRSENNKIQDDPRITKLGKFIRKYSIDEFPQMFDVLLGSMSLVGPRPLRPDEAQLYRDQSEEHSRQLDKVFEMKPGITGLWQVSGRSNISFKERMILEEKYSRARSIMLDITILAKTPLAAIQGEGAY